MHPAEKAFVGRRSCDPCGRTEAFRNRVRPGAVWVTGIETYACEDCARIPDEDRQYHDDEWEYENLEASHELS